MRKISIILLLAVGAIITAQAHRATDANIFGCVVNRATGEHLPHVNISVKGTTIGVVADATGHFRINNLPVGTLTVAASFLGFETQEIEINTVLGQSIEVSFQLDESAFALDQVVVSANRSATNRREVVSLVNVITPLTFEKTGSSLLAEGLNFLPGLRVESNCNTCGFTQLRINGLEGHYTQILIDGRPINSALAGVYNLEHIPANMIERVEVVRGGLSALFGSGAIGGTVNIIMRETLRNSVSAGNVTNLIYGNTPDNITTLNASIVSDNNRAGITLFASARQRSPLDIDGDNFSELGKINMTNIGFRGFYRTGYNSRLTFNYHAIDEFRRGGEMFDADGTNLFVRPPHEAMITKQTDYSIHSGGATYDIFFNDARHALQVYISMQHIERGSYFGTRQDLDAYGHTQDFTIVSGGQYTVRMDRLGFMPATFIGGVEHSYNSLHDRMPGHRSDFDQTVEIYSLFAQNEWSNRRASFLIGARVDKHSKIDRPIVTPRIGGRYTPFSWLTLRGSYASGYRGPQAFDEDLHIAAVGGGVAWIEIAEGLRPEMSHSFMLSTEFTKLFADRRAFTFLAEGFYTRLNDVFILEVIGRDGVLNHSRGLNLTSADDIVITPRCAPIGENLILERRNGPSAVVAGVNLEANFIASKNFQINSGFTIQRAMYTDLVRWSDFVLRQRRMFRTPNHYGYFTAMYSPVRQLELSLSGVYTGSMLVQHFGAHSDDPTIEDRHDREVNTPHFFDAGFRVAYNFSLADNVTLQLNGGVRNMFNSFQRDFDQGLYRDSKYTYGPVLPRTVFFGVRLTM